jgi:hypothetical protein
MQRDWHKSRNILTWMVWLCVICFFFLVDNVNAQVKQINVPNVSESSNTPPGSPTWGPPSALPDKFDWIQLTSGEWLKGDLKVLYDDELEFDSDELDLLELDWEDVKQVRGHQPHSVRFEGSMVVVGILKVVDDKVIVTTEEEVLEFDRSRLLSIAHGEGKEIGYWSTKISIGLDVRSGNSDQTQYNAAVNAKRRTSGSRLSIDYLSIFNTTEGVETANSQKVSSYYDIFKTKKFFWRPVFGEYYRDIFLNIEHRFSVGTGIGYHIMDTSKTELDITPGLAYQYNQNISVETGEDAYNSTLALVVHVEYDTELSKRVDLNGSYKFDIVNQDSGSYTHRALAALEIELRRRLDLDLSLMWDRIQKPKPEADGRVPDRDDYYLVFAIEFEL